MRVSNVCGNTKQAVLLVSIETANNENMGWDIQMAVESKNGATVLEKSFLSLSHTRDSSWRKMSAKVSCPAVFLPGESSVILKTSLFTKADEDLSEQFAIGF